MDAYPGCTIRCISGNGVAYRRSMDLEDRRTSKGVRDGEEVVVERASGDWVLCKDGWLPLQIAGVRKFEALAAPASSSSKRPAAASRPQARGSQSGGTEDKAPRVRRPPRAPPSRAPESPPAREPPALEPTPAEPCRDDRERPPANAATKAAAAPGPPCRAGGEDGAARAEQEREADAAAGQVERTRDPEPERPRAAEGRAELLEAAAALQGPNAEGQPAGHVEEAAAGKGGQPSELGQHRAACAAERSRLASEFMASATNVGLEAPEEVLRRVAEDPSAPQKGKLLARYAELCLALQSCGGEGQGEREPRALPCESPAPAPEALPKQPAVAGAAVPRPGAPADVTAVAAASAGDVAPLTPAKAEPAQRHSEITGSTFATSAGAGTAEGVLREGWVVKQSQHVGVWRRRWMVLHADGLVSFFQDQSKCVETASFQIRGGVARKERDAKGPVVLDVLYPSTRRMMLRCWSREEGLGKATDLVFDAGAETGCWRRCLEEAFPEPQLVTAGRR